MTAARSARGAQVWDRVDQDRALEGVRTIWASRTQARTRADLLYLIYVAVLSVFVLGIPALRAAGAALARPDVLPVLVSDPAQDVATAALPLGIAAAVLAGGVRGPALLAPFFTASLAGSALPRHRVLWRPFARAALLPLLGSICCAALLGATMHAEALTTPGAGFRFGAAAGGSGVLLAAGWLLGEVLTIAGRRLAAGALSLAALAVTIAPQPLLLGAVYPPAPASSATLWTLVLAGAGVGAAAVAIPLLDRLRGSVLLEQSLRWESATISATTGDLGAATGTYRALAETGRHLPALGGGPLPWRYLRRDAVAWLRTPSRSTAGLIATVGGAALLATSLLHSGPLAWAGVAAATVILWVAGGPFVDGIRHAVHSLGAPALLGQTAGTQAALHAIAPTLLLTVGAALGGTAGLAASGHGSATMPALVAGALYALLVPVLLMPVLVLGRIWAAAKGPMPLALATPMPTPQGDVSVILIMLWQSDAVLLALAAGIVLALLAGLSLPALAAGVFGLAVSVALLARSRFRALRA